MKTNIQTKRGFTLVELLVVIVIIASLAGLTAPMVIRQRKKADQTEATSNARQIGLALFEFEVEFGTFPDDASGPKTNGIATYTTFNGNANGYFTQLLSQNITQSEAIFYCKTARSKVKPDGNISSDALALAAGEVGFAYILDGAAAGQTTSGNPARAIAATPFTVAAADLATGFDKAPYDNKAVILKIDGSVSSLTIDANGAAILVPGAAPVLLSDVGATTIWDAVVPTASMPEI